MGFCREAVLHSGATEDDVNAAGVITGLGPFDQATVSPEIFGSDPPQRGVRALALVLGVCQAVPFLALLLWHRCILPRRRRAAGRTSTILAPAYMVILYALFLTWLVFGAVNVAYTVRPYPHASHSVGRAVASGLSEAVYHFVLEGIGVFLCMTGGGWKSLKRASGIAAVISVIVGGLHAMSMLTSYWAPGADAMYGFIPLLSYEGLLFLMYLVILLAPIHWFHRRPAATVYALVWTVYRPIYIVNVVTMFYGYEEGYCSYMAISWLLWGIAKPFIVFKIFQLDSKYWLGISQPFLCRRAQAREPITPRDPLEDTELNAEVASLLAVRMDGFGKSCPIIPFTAVELLSKGQIVESEAKHSQMQDALLKARMQDQERLKEELRKKEATSKRQLEAGEDARRRRLRRMRVRELAVIGSGGTAKVYRGYYHKRHVAVKMVFSPELARSTVENFCAENALMCSLRHPCVVEVYGVCVIPPSLCSIMELCSNSLTGYLASVKRHAQGRCVPLLHKLAFAVDCCDAVACLHRQNPPIIHKDIKGQNFLRGRDTVARWTNRDVIGWLMTMGLAEFADDFRSRRIKGWGRDFNHPGLMTIAPEEVHRLVSRRHDPAAVERLEMAVAQLRKSVQMHTEVQCAIKLTDFELSQKKDQSESQTPDTANWTAPELFREDGRPTTASDVYALTMVLWEVFHQEIPFEKYGEDCHRVRDLVLGGERPPLKGIPQELQKLLELGWHANPDMRPTAEHMRDRLMEFRDVLRTASATQQLNRSRGHARSHSRTSSLDEVSLSNISMISGLTVDSLEMSDDEGDHDSLDSEQAFLHVHTPPPHTPSRLSVSTFASPNRPNQQGGATERDPLLSST